jgi:hypothetical protein
MTSEQIKKKMIIGDFVTLGLLLGINPGAARMRYKREKPEAVEGMIKIIESRDQLISSEFDKQFAT